MQDRRREYEKPTVTRVTLRPEEQVLTNCKTIPDTWCSMVDPLNLGSPDAWADPQRTAKRDRVRGCRVSGTTHKVGGLLVKQATGGVPAREPEVETPPNVPLDPASLVTRNPATV